MRWFWILIFLVQAFAAGAWWWLLPGGFPIDNWHFWANQVLPWFIFSTGLAGVIAAFNRSSLAAQFALVPALSCLIAGPLCLFLFPISMHDRWTKLFGVGIVLLVLKWLTGRGKSWSRARPEHTVTVIGWALLAGCGAGVVLPIAQLAPDPSTRPLNVELSGAAAIAPKDNTEAPAHPAELPLSPAVAIDTAAAEVTVRGEALTLRIQPLLTFVSRSIDRCWTSLSPDWLSGEHPRDCISAETNGRRATVGYDSLDGVATLSCDATFPEGTAIDARTSVDHSVFSHLNSFCALQISGQKKALALEFSPCVGARIDVLPADYPHGRPERFAYIDAEKVFHVAEASSGEKGPFKDLATGRITDDQPLAITIYEDGIARARIEFDDFETQCSVALSPTAGWGVPVNAIEFQRIGDAPESPVQIYMTLAGTSVGRGWDSVGHAEGVYRNRMRVMLLK